MTAFNYSTAEGINCVYPKEEISEEDISELADDMLCEGLKNLVGRDRYKASRSTDALDEDDELYKPRQQWGPYIKGRNSRGDTYKLLDCLNEDLDAGKKNGNH